MLLRSRVTPSGYGEVVLVGVDFDLAPAGQPAVVTCRFSGLSDQQKKCAPVLLGDSLPHVSVQSWV